MSRTPTQRRRAWLALRRAIGRARPAPVVVRVVNAASVSTRPAKAIATWQAALATPGRWGSPTVVLGQEMADVNTRRVSRGGWHLSQAYPIGSPSSALAAAVREDAGTLHDVELIPGSPPTREGGGIRERPILTGRISLSDGWSLTWANGHAPPRRAPQSRATYLAAFKGVRRAALKVGDLNIPRRPMTRLFSGRRVHSTGVMHAAVARWIPSRSATVDVGSDHLALDIILWP